MTRATTIARRELTSYFYSPIAYVAMAVFLIACSFTFWDDFQPGEIAGMRNLFNWMVWLLVSIVPLLSMGLLAQEWSTGTIEALMTAPVSESDVVLGKFLGSFAFFLVMLAPTLLYAAILALYANPRIDFGPIRARRAVTAYPDTVDRDVQPIWLEERAGRSHRGEHPAPVRVLAIDGALEQVAPGDGTPDGHRVVLGRRAGHLDGDGLAGPFGVQHQLPGQVRARAGQQGCELGQTRPRS